MFTIRTLGSPYKIKGEYRMKLLTANQKLKLRDKLIERDGTKCLYCNCELNINDCDIDHLDNNPKNNNEENLLLCHHKCNLEKRNNFDYQIISSDKLKFNQNRILRTHLEDESEYGNSPEIEHNVKVKEFVKQMLYEKINTDGEIEWDDALNGFTYLASEKFGHCSQTTIRRHLDAFTSSYAPYMKIKNNKGLKVIVRRAGN